MYHFLKISRQKFCRLLFSSEELDCSNVIFHELGNKMMVVHFQGKKSGSWHTFLFMHKLQLLDMSV